MRNREGREVGTGEVHTKGLLSGSTSGQQAPEQDEDGEQTAPCDRHTGRLGMGACYRKSADHRVWAGPTLLPSHQRKAWEDFKQGVK